MVIVYKLRCTEMVRLSLREKNVFCGLFSFEFLQNILYTIFYFNYKYVQSHITTAHWILLKSLTLHKAMCIVSPRIVLKSTLFISVIIFEFLGAQYSRCFRYFISKHRGINYLINSISYHN